MSDAPMKPFWTQPSHPSIQKVIFSPNGFTSKSVSTVSVKPFGIFAKLEFPSCTAAEKPTYATVQYGRNSHLNLNSDLVYINHSCEPSLIFNMSTLTIHVGPKGLIPGDELTFFYPSTEWSMSQPFDCFCQTPSCKGTISGASQMTASQLEGMWLNGYIWDMIAERDGDAVARGEGEKGRLQALVQAKGEDLMAWKGDGGGDNVNGHGNGVVENGHGKEANGKRAGVRGVSSREMSGEMGGDTQ